MKGEWILAGYASGANSVVTAPNGIDYTYRETGTGQPLILFQHFRGNLDYWDPALVDALAANRRVIAFDNTGVGGSSGTTPSTVAEMARDALVFLDLLDITQADVLGYSLGSFVAQELALTRPDFVRRLVLASAAPQGAPGMHGWAPEVIGAIGKPEAGPEDYLAVFFTESEESRAAGQQVLGRIYGRTEDRDKDTNWQTRQAQYDAICAWGIPDHGVLERVTGIAAPVLVANGDSDPMILPRYSHLLGGLIPNAQVAIYPDAAHGFLFQHHAAFAADVLRFLT